MKKPKQPPAEKAFERSDKHVLGDLKLKPWTPSRVIAAQNMGMLYPRIGKEGWDQFQRTKMYPGALKDTIIVLWLCALNDDEVDDADRAPQEAYKTAQKWSAGLGIHKINSDAFWAAYGKFTEIMMEINNSATKPKNTEEPDDDEDEDETPPRPRIANEGQRIGEDSHGYRVTKSPNG